MSRHSRGLLFNYLLAGALALPLAAGWSGGVSRAEGTPAAAATPAHTYRIVQLTAAEVGALGLPQSTNMSVAQQQANGYANPAFLRTWARTDNPVANGTVKRSWYWGPAPISAGLQEDYAEGVGGKRLVQYFDKSRMEINNPAADRNNPFYVTNGLLSVELISGKMQTGNSAYVTRWPAQIDLASDSDDTAAPTYASFQGVSNTPLGDHPATSKVGQPATGTITRSGTTGNDPTKASYPDVNIVYFDPNTKHNVPKAIWDFLNQAGPVYDNNTNRTSNARLSDPWFYATGLPISDPYWARVKIAGQQQDVLIQAFERRVVTYVPNGVPGFKVQMGNIGQHYYDWRYKDAGKPAGGGPPPGTTPTVPVVNNTPTPPPPPPPADPCVGIPPSQSATVTPNCGQAGSRFTFAAHGFTPGESVGIYVTDADQAVYGARFQLTADSSGSIGGVYITTLPEDNPGIWAFTGEGITSHFKAIGYFKVYSTSAGPTATPGGASTSCSDVPPPQNMTVQPNTCNHAGTRFLFAGHGFTPGENVGVYVTEPSQAVYGAPFQVQADSSGTAGGVSFTTQAGFPLGIWALTMEGTSSHARAIGYFKLIP